MTPLVQQVMQKFGRALGGDVNDDEQQAAFLSPRGSRNEMRELRAKQKKARARRQKEDAKAKEAARYPWSSAMSQG